MKITAGNKLVGAGIATCAALALVAAAGPVTAARGIGIPAACAKSFDAYKAPVSLLRSCGDTITPLRHVTALPGGGKAYNYGSYTWLAPPAHFNVRTASDKQLAEYGLPTHKQLGRHWYGAVGRIRHFVQPPAYLVRVPAMKNATVTSKTADGHYVSGHTYNKVTGTWTEPHFVGAGCSGDAFSQWAGLGGIGTSSLGQTGTAFNEQNLAAHQGFIETIINGDDPGPTPVSGFVPGPGDSVAASVTWNSPHYEYLLVDQTTGNSSGTILSRIDNSPDNSTAEIISERPTDAATGLPVQLSDFQSVSVRNATSYWSGGSAGFVNNPTHNSIIMENGSGPIIATTTNLDSSSGFTNTWERCQG